MAVFEIPMARAFRDATNAPAPATVAYFYEPGTTTPKTVYTSITLTVAHGTSVTADANGVFPQVFVNGSAGVKVDYQYLGASLAGYPRDNVNGYPPQGLEAAAIPFDATARIAADDAQEAIQDVDRTVEIDQAANALIASGGSANAYSLTPAITSYSLSIGDVHLMRASFANTGACTLAVGGTTAKAIKFYTGGAKVDPASGQIQTGHILRLRYDGADWVVTDHWRPMATTAEAQAGTVQGVLMDPALTRSAIDARAARFVEATPVDLSSGSPTQAEWTGLPANIIEITLHLHDVSTTGTDGFTLTIGDSGGYEATGYNSSFYSGAQGYSTTTFQLTNGSAAAGVYGGQVILKRASSASNIWTVSGMIGSTANGFNDTYGSKALSGVLDRVEFGLTGADTFDAGTVNITYMVSE